MAMKQIGVAAVTAAISAAFLLLTCDVVLAQGTAPTRPPYRLNQLTTQSTHTFPCNPTGGTAALQACTLQSYFSWSGSTLGINTMVGDTGSGGAVGLVPAPAAGDAAAGKYLSAAGTYSAPAGGGGGSGTVNAGTAGQLGYYATTSSAISGNANATISSGALTLGQTGSIIGKMLFAGNTSGAVTIQPQAAAGAYNFNLPTTAGSAGQPMLSGGGVAAPMTFGTLAVGGGGTGLASGTSGGIPYFSSTSAMTSSAALTAHGVVVGGGAGTSPTSTSAGTAGQPLTSGGASADPTFGTLAVGGGGTGLTAGTSGGIPYFSSTSAISSSALLTANNPIIGGGAGVSPASGTRSGNTTTFATTTGALTSAHNAGFDASGNIVDIGVPATVTSVALSVPATSILGVTGSPVTGAGTLGLTTTGTSGGIPYFSSTSAMTSSAALTAHGVVIGGGAGVAPTSSAAGTTGQVLTSNGASADPTFQSGAGAALTTTDGTNTVTATTSQTFGSPFLVGTTGTGLATINLTQKVNSQTGGTYTIQTTDGTKVVEGGAFTYTYPLATLTAGFSTRVHNVGTSGNMTLSSTGGNFTGLGVANATTFTLAPGEAADISTIAGPLGLVQKFTPSATGTTPTLIVPITYIPGINPNNIPIAQINATRTITAIKCRPEVAAGGTATISVVKAASGTALSAGTVLHSGSCNANGTAATDQTLTVTTSSLAAGDTLGIITTGTTIWTSSGVATGVVTVYMQ